MACYAGKLLASWEGFSLWPRFLFAGQKKAFVCSFDPFKAFSTVITKVNFSSNKCKNSTYHSCKKKNTMKKHIGIKQKANQYNKSKETVFSK